MIRMSMHSYIYLRDVTLLIHPNQLTACCDNQQYLADHVLKVTRYIRMVCRDEAQHIANWITAPPRSSPSVEYASIYLLCGIVLVIHANHTTACCDNHQYVADHVLTVTRCISMVAACCDNHQYVTDHILNASWIHTWLFNLSRPISAIQ